MPTTDSAIEAGPDTRPGTSSGSHASDTGAIQESDDEPDIMLDVKDAKVGLIEFVLDDLLAHVALDAEVAKLLKVSVGADVRLGSVRLTVKDVHVAAYLQVNLERLQAILSRALRTRDRNPELLEALVKPIGQAVGPRVGSGLGQTLPQVGGGLGQAAGEIGGSLGKTVSRVGGGFGSRIRGGIGRMVSRLGDGFGHLGRAGNRLGELLSGGGSDLGKAGPDIDGPSRPGPRAPRTEE